MKKILLCAWAVFLLIFISVNAQAYLFSQLPGTTPMGYSSNLDTAQVADDFILSSASPINSVKWWGFDEGGGWSGTSNFTFTFYADNSGSPGGSLLTTSGSLTSGIWDSGNRVYVYTSVLNSPFSAEAGTKYWLSIFDKNTGSTWGWMMSDGGTSYQNLGDGEWTPIVSYVNDNPMYSNAAFELAYQPVPIPTAGWLLASGLIALVLIRRRMRR